VLAYPGCPGKEAVEQVHACLLHDSYIISENVHSYLFSGNLHSTVFLTFCYHKHQLFKFCLYLTKNSKNIFGWTLKYSVWYSLIYICHPDALMVFVMIDIHVIV